MSRKNEAANGMTDVSPFARASPALCHLWKVDVSLRECSSLQAGPSLSLMNEHTAV